MTNRPRADAANAHQYQIYPSTTIAVAQWVRRRSVDLIRDFGVRLNAVAPGMTETPLIAAGRNHSDLDRRNLEKFAASIPAGTTAQPDMIADPVLFLLSPLAVFITGQILVIDGGQDALLRPDHL